MRFAVSNIAWTPDERLEAYRLAAVNGIDGLEIAPGLLFHNETDPFDPGDAAVARAIREIDDAGLTLVSMQSLLFGITDAALFGTTLERTAFRTGLRSAIALAGRLGIPNLVFGSPRQRRFPTETGNRAEAIAEAVEAFRMFGDACEAAGTALAVEPNPAVYGTDFLNTFEEVEGFVRKVDHPAIRPMLDLGAMRLNNQWSDIGACIRRSADRLSHVHVSEPYLLPAPADAEATADVLNILEEGGYGRAVSIEMKRPQTGLDGLGRAFARLGDARLQASLR